MITEVVPPGHTFSFIVYVASPRYGIMPEPWRLVLTPARLAHAQRLLTGWGYPAVLNTTAIPAPTYDVWLESFTVTGRVGPSGRTTPVILLVEALEAAAGEKMRVMDIVIGEDLVGKFVGKVGRELAMETLHLLPWWGWALIGGAALVALKGVIRDIL